MGGPDSTVHRIICADLEIQTLAAGGVAGTRTRPSRRTNSHSPSIHSRCPPPRMPLVGSVPRAQAGRLGEEASLVGATLAEAGSRWPEPPTPSRAVAISLAGARMRSITSVVEAQPRRGSSSPRPQANGGEPNGEPRTTNMVDTPMNVPERNTQNYLDVLNGYEGRRRTGVDSAGFWVRIPEKRTQPQVRWGIQTKRTTPGGLGEPNGEPPVPPRLPFRAISLPDCAQVRAVGRSSQVKRRYSLPPYDLRLWTVEGTISTSHQPKRLPSDIREAGHPRWVQAKRRVDRSPGRTRW